MPGASELVESKISKQEKNRNSLTLEEQMPATAHKKEMPCVLSVIQTAPPVGKNVVADALLYSKCLAIYA